MQNHRSFENHNHAACKEESWKRIWCHKFESNKYEMVSFILKILLSPHTTTQVRPTHSALSKYNNFSHAWHKEHKYGLIKHSNKILQCKYYITFNIWTTRSICTYQFKEPTHLKFSKSPLSNNCRIQEFSIR